MALPTLNLTPGQGSYAADPDADTLRAKLGGGPARYRRDQIGIAVTVNVQWRCTRLQFDYLEAFFATAVPGSQPFLAELIIDYADPLLYVARLIPGTKRLGGVQGNLRVVEAQLDVKPAKRNATRDRALTAAYGAYGDAVMPAFDRLARFANLDVRRLNAPVDFDFTTGGMPAFASFSRASTAPYTDADGKAATAGVDVARFDYGTDTQSLALTNALSTDGSYERIMSVDGTDDGAIVKGYPDTTGSYRLLGILIEPAAGQRAADRLVLDWQAQRGAAGNRTVRYTFDDGSTQDVATAITAGGVVVPTNLRRSHIYYASLL